MGSAIVDAFSDEDFRLVDEDDPNRGPFLHELPLDLQDRLTKRWMERLERKYPHSVFRGVRSKEERILPHVQRTLHHYNSNNKGAEFDPVEPLTCNSVGFRDETWFHINFFARRRDALPDTSVQYFFAELHYDRFDTPVVETCTILEKPLDRFKNKCAFCKGTVGILHPSNGEFVCGKAGQKKEFIQICMWRKRPKEKLVSVEEPASVQELFNHLPLTA